MNRLIYLRSGLALAPSTLKRIVGQVDPSRFDEKLSPDRFSLREVVAHMADMEPMMRGRMELALSSPRAAVANWDQDAEAIAKNYPAWDVSKSLQMYSDGRLKTLDLFESLSEEQILQTVKHELLGVLSIYDLAVFLLGHDCYHFDQISQYFPARHKA